MQPSFVTNHNIFIGPTIKQILRYLQGMPYASLAYQKYSNFKDFVMLSTIVVLILVNCKMNTFQVRFGTHYIELLGGSQGHKCTYNLSQMHSILVHLWAPRIMWFVRCYWLPLDKATPLFIDNHNTIRLVKNPQHHKCTQYMDIQYHYIRESLKHGKIDTSYVSTDRHYIKSVTS